MDDETQTVTSESLTGEDIPTAQELSEAAIDLDVILRQNPALGLALTEAEVAITAAAINSAAGVVAETPVVVLATPERQRATVLPAGVAILGYEVSWNVQGMLIARDDLKLALTATGFASALPKRPPTAKRALRRAIAEWAVGQGADSDLFDGDDNADTTRRKSLIREIKTRAERGQIAPTVYALVEEISLGSQFGLRYATSFRFRYDPNQEGDDAGENTGGLRVTTTQFGPMVEEERQATIRDILPIWERHKRLYTGADLTLILQEIVRDARGISVEAGSGVWFVPARSGAVVDRLEDLVRAFSAITDSGYGHIRVRENIDWPRTRESLAQAALDDLQSEMRQVEQSIGRFEVANKDVPGSVRTATMAGLIKDMIDIKSKAILYRETVGLREERFVEQITTLGLRAGNIARANKTLREARMVENQATTNGQSDTPATPTVLVPVTTQRAERL